MCEAILAYKSKNGSLYSSKTECERHTKIWEDNQRRYKVFDALKRALDRPLDHYKVYYDKGMTVHEVAHFIAFESTGHVWKELRDNLNRID